MPFNYNPHALAFTGKREHLNNFRSVPGRCEVGPAEFLCELKKGSLSLASNEDPVAGVGIGIFESRRVDGNSFVEKRLDLIRKNSIQLRLFNGEIQRMFARDLSSRRRSFDLFSVGTSSIFV